MEVFDAIRIDNLHGDRIISEYAPDGRTSETVFALQGQSPGIKIGTSIALFSKLSANTSSKSNCILYRDFHQAKAVERRRALLDSLDAPAIDAGYSELKPDLRLGLPFKPMVVSEDWFDWPTLPKLFPVSFPGVQTGRDTFLVDVDLGRLKERVGDYFNTSLRHEEIARRYPRVMTDTARFEARRVRDTLLTRGGPDEAGFVRYAYRPFDNRWIYWEAETKLLREKSPRYPRQVFEGNVGLVAQQKPRRDWSPPQVISHIGCLDLMDRGATCVPVWLRDEGMGNRGDGLRRRPNLSAVVQRYLKHINASVEDLFHHVLAVLHDPAYRETNAGALRMDWPRIPLPGWSDGDAPEAAETLVRSAARGRELAALLNPETPVPGVTTGTLRPEIATIAVPTAVDGRNMAGDDFALIAGWGHFGTGDAVMPGQGRIVERAYTADERAALGMLRRARSDHVRYLPERQCLLAQRPGGGLALQAGRLSGT